MIKEEQENKYNWKAWYLLVLLANVILILAFYLITKTFS
jgi:hypothetical protein